MDKGGDVRVLAYILRQTIEYGLPVDQEFLQAANEPGLVGGFRGRNGT